MQFNPDRVATQIKKLKEAQQQKAQKRMDSFFVSTGTTSSTFKRPAETKVVKGKGAKRGKFGRGR